MNPQPGAGGTPFPNADYGGSPPGGATAAHSPAQPPFPAVAANSSPTGPVPVPPASLKGPPPPPGSPTLPANPSTTVDVPFEPASAILPAEAASALKDLAHRRGQHAIVVVGRGDATSANPELQSQALSLALHRAQAIAQALAADGVPDAAIRIDSEASGRGGAARIVE
jgi:outer membrane protein OmpA-like peptidoglycan-associated protein